VACGHIEGCASQFQGQLHLGGACVWGGGGGGSKG
jgi:hypothetical protein